MRRHDIGRAPERKDDLRIDVWGEGSRGRCCVRSTERLVGPAPETETTEQDIPRGMFG